ncbi:MAG: heme lyase CcmF/NrfE family subunit [Nitrospinota bacterium]|nr:heme lyase CcmF/NrfE family subunit [Nitrospinota bacterium]
MFLIDLGKYSIFSALVLSVTSIFFSFFGGFLKNSRFIKVGINSAISVFVLIVAASCSLIYLLMVRDYRVKYVANHVNNSLEAFYRFSAFWGGQEGSLMLWLLLLCLYCYLVIRQNLNRNLDLMPFVVGTLMVTAFFFLFLLNFMTLPFDLNAIPPVDGKGLNPLLQDWGMVIHPPNLYIGYVGYVVPFSFCIAALISGKLDDQWIQTIRRWTLFAWFFNGTGILLGGAWAYKELGWGGYWAWDPVENASLMPWLTATAFLHSVIIQEKRGMLKVWNVVLIILTYLLTIFGTFVTRSGILSSVHAFANSNFGWVFLVYLLFALFISFLLVFFRLSKLKSEHELESFFSREAGFLLNNVVFVSITFAIFWGTMFPVVSELVEGIKVTVGPPFFDQVNVPMGMFLLLLLGAGPLMAWRITSVSQMKKSFLVPIIVGLLGVFVLVLFEIHHLFAVMAFSLSVFSISAIFLEFYKGSKLIKERLSLNYMSCFWLLTMNNKRRFGGYIVHLGMAILFVGVAASSAYQVTEEVRLRPGESFHVGSVRMRYEGFKQEISDSYRAVRAKLSVFNMGHLIGTVFPERRIYFTPPQPTTEAGIGRGFLFDIYAVFSDVDSRGAASFKFMVNPLLNWIWFGGIVFSLGSIICFLPDRWGKRKGEIFSLKG